VKNPVIPHLQALTEGPNIQLDKPIILIGRHQECDIQIPSRKISRRHCCLAQVGDHLVIRDLGSTNGVRINGVKVMEGNLQPGDELMIGNVRYQLKWGESSDRPSGSPNGDRLPLAAHAAPDELEHGIMDKKKPPPAHFGPADISYDNPVALPDMSLSHPMPQGKPASKKQADKNGLLLPDDVELIPLDPP
jgi:predicted component of type VI protein secretion system